MQPTKKKKSDCDIMDKHAILICFFGDGVNRLITIGSGVARIFQHGVGAT